MGTFLPARAPGRSLGEEYDPRPRVNWWLRLTSSGWDKPQTSIEQRELVRRSRLASWIILGLLVADVVLIAAGAGDMATLISVLAFGVGLLLVAALNRAGLVAVAGVLLIGLICLAVIGAVASDPRGLTLDALPAYDLLTVAVVVGASVLPSAFAFGVAGLNVALISLDFFLQPHAPSLVTEYGQYPSPTAAALALLARPIALQIVLAVVAYLWVRGTDQAIRRADRAEEIATLEHSLADQKRQLDLGIQQILQTHIRAANGDFSARTPLGQENILWQIAASLNNLLARLQRAGQAEHQLRRTEEELRRLATAIDDAQAGKRPIWPAPSGTAADWIIERINRGARTGTQPSGPRTFGEPDAMTPAAPPSHTWQPTPPPQYPFSAPSQPLRDEWERQGQEPDRMPSNPWVFPPEAEEHP
ncbi:MAG: hypothetical protein IVW57_12305 [Ktedonobacterales bacterium]|nr:hypothetical protein [Ktedonobacterales bacterium]